MLLKPAQAFAPVEQISYAPWLQRQVKVFVLRLDKFFPEVSGNKYFKLKHSLAYVQQQGIKQLVSFGGAYSNHIHALAYASKQLGIASVGIIRGEAVYADNPTLSDARRWGMSLNFVSRDTYRRRAEQDYLHALQREYSQALIIPEGGSNEFAVQGCAEIVMHIQQAIDNNFDSIILPCGTGATLAGIVSALPSDKQVLGVVVLKGATYLHAQINQYLALQQTGMQATWQLLEDFHCGGYAKCNVALAKFIQGFQLPVEPVYSGKMFFALDQLINSGSIKPGSRIVAIHTGGLQGLRGMQPLMNKYLNTATK